MGYFARERIFTGYGPHLNSSSPVFFVDDLTDDECKTLAASVQRYLDSLQIERYCFELEPAVDEDPIAYINLKQDWNEHESNLDRYRQETDDNWKHNIAWLHDIAEEHADIIRDLRQYQTTTIYLQCDSGHGYSTFDRVDSLTNREVEILEEALMGELREMGMRGRVVGDLEAEREPALFVQAAFEWDCNKDELEGEDVENHIRSAQGAAWGCIEQILALRKKPILYGGVDSDSNDEVDEIPFADDERQQDQNASLILPSDDLRQSYQDPSNYWRNVWLYEQRKNGATNAVMLAELGKRARDFAPLESENALRSAIRSIAIFHKWPLQTGKAGRPRKSPVAKKSTDSTVN